jgi:hypothetical protein
LHQYSADSDRFSGPHRVYARRGNRVITVTRANGGRRRRFGSFGLVPMVLIGTLSGPLVTGTRSNSCRTRRLQRIAFSVSARIRQIPTALRTSSRYSTVLAMANRRRGVQRAIAASDCRSRRQ